MASATLSPVRVVCVSFCLALGGCAGMPTPAPGLDLDWLRQPRTVDYAVAVDGAPVGWSRVATGASPDGRRLLRDTRLEMRLPGGRLTRSASHEEYALTPPFSLLLRREQRENGEDGEDTSGVELRRVDGGFEVRTADRVEPRFLAGDYGLSDAFAEMAWIRRDPAAGATLVRRILDTDALDVATSRLQVTAVRHVTTGGAPATRYDVISHGDDGSTEAMTYDADGVAVRWQLGTLELRRDPAARARAAAFAGAPAALPTVPVDRPLGDPRTVRRLVVEATGPGIGALASQGMQTTMPIPGGVRVDIDVEREGATATASDVARASRATVRYPADDPNLLELASRARGDATTPRAIVPRLVAFVADFVGNSATDTDHVTVQDIVRVRKGDCSDHVALFVTLARACGVPARAVTGLQYAGDETVAFVPHDWCEVAIDGHWLPVDPTWNEVPASAARLRFGLDEVVGSGTTRLRLHVERVEHGEHDPAR